MIISINKDSSIDVEPFVFIGMDTPGTRNRMQSSALRWLFGIALAALIAVSVMLISGASNSTRAITQPTPCPDTIACHALKRMPTQSVLPASAP